MKISFSGGNDPYTFSYSHDGIVQNSITTSLNPYIISTKNEGVYELVSFSDVNELGSVSGSAIVTIIESPEALFTLVSDTLSVINSTTSFSDNSNSGSSTINSWLWNFGDNSFGEIVQNPYHSYDSDPGLYKVSLIVSDMNSLHRYNI